MSGPLQGIKVVEFAGIGPGPHATMMLADMGADVVRVVRPKGSRMEMPGDTLLRNRKTVEADLKNPDDIKNISNLLAHADVLVEGFRPGVMERLGLGPENLAAINPGLVYGRITGWGQDGPWADKPGHDLNYIAITGLLEATGTLEDPVVPLNLFGDFGGGSMMLVTGILAALLERGRSGKGQTVDAAMVDGVSQLAQMMWSYRSTGMWVEKRASNILDGGAHFYGVYRCADNRHVAVGAIEPQFYGALLAGLNLDLNLVKTQHDRNAWPEMRAQFEAIFLTKTRDEWAELFENTDACVTPILTMTEATSHPHMTARNIFGNVDGKVQPLPAPRFDRTPSNSNVVPPNEDIDTVEDTIARWQENHIN